METVHSQVSIDRNRKPQCRRDRKNAFGHLFSSTISEKRHYRNFPRIWTEIKRVSRS
ncbi:MAG: hypothetical protein ACJAY8_001219, partial [Sphingobacteriales bacterium]